MPTPGEKIDIDEDRPEAGLALEANLLRTLRSGAPQGENTSFVLSARSPKAGRVGGLTATTSYGWLLIKVLWVSDDHRGHGIGRALVAAAEARGRSAACHGAWLDTSNPDARTFYATLGYETFAELENTDGAEPAGHCRWFMKKRI